MVVLLSGVCTLSQCSSCHRSTVCPSTRALTKSQPINILAAAAAMCVRGRDRTYLAVHTCTQRVARRAVGSEPEGRNHNIAGRTTKRLQCATINQTCASEREAAERGRQKKERKRGSGLGHKSRFGKLYSISTVR